MAKELLHGWLRLADRDLDDQLPKGFSTPFGWRTGNYGVHMELPFYDETEAYYFECTPGLVECGLRVDDWRDAFKEGYPKGKLLFVPDITIFHKGCPSIVVEVVHKSSVSKSKLDKIIAWGNKHADLEVWEIEADNILNQTNLRCNLKFELIYSRFLKFNAYEG